jgi:hypothetical protein
MSASIDNAANTIKDNLDQGIFDWDVTHDELTENSRKVAELTPQERNQLVSQLSDDDLKNWTQEIDGWSGALTASERDDLFRDLTAGLDGTQTTRLVDAFDGSPQGREALGNAVAKYASSDAKVAFINASKDSIDGEYSATDGRDGNAETVVLSKVLGSLNNDPARFDSAVKSLSDKQLEAVMTVGLGRQHIVDFSGQTPGTDVYSPSATMQMLDGASRSSDPEVKRVRSSHQTIPDVGRRLTGQAVHRCRHQAGQEQPRGAGQRIERAHRSHRTVAERLYEGDVDLRK